MSPEAGRYLDKARKLLADGETMLAVGLNEAAGRNAYLAGFHAAQAFLFDGVGKVFKSHHGVQAEFLRLTKDDPRIEAEHRAFLSRAHNLKAVADYETGPGSEISHERAAAAIETGKRFVAMIAERIAAATPKREPSST